MLARAEPSSAILNEAAARLAVPPVLETYGGAEGAGSPGVGSWLLTLFLTVSLIVALIFLSVARYARKETVGGSLAPSGGLVRVMAPQPGVLVSVPVKEGQLVEAGDRLAVLSSDRAVSLENSIGAMNADAIEERFDAVSAQEATTSELTEAQVEKLRQERAGLNNELTILAEQKSQHVRREANARLNLEAVRKVREDGFLSDMKLREYEDALSQAEISTRSLMQQEAQVRSRLAQTLTDELRVKADMRHEQARLSDLKAQLREQQATILGQNQIVLRAPKKGRIAGLQAREGSFVQQGGAITALLPEQAKLRAQLWVPSRAIGFVRPGDRVRIMYEAFPFQRFGLASATVVKVSDAPIDPREMPLLTNAQEALYLVEAELERQDVSAYGRSWPLISGMKLSGDMVLEQRSLLTWLLDPLIAAHKRRGEGL